MFSYKDYDIPIQETEEFDLILDDDASQKNDADNDDQSNINQFDLDKQEEEFASQNNEPNKQIPSHLLNFNPLKHIHKQEESIFLAKSTNRNIDSKLILTSFEDFEECKSSNIVYQALDKINNQAFISRSSSRNSNQNDNFGVPRSLTVLPGRYYVLGTSKGMALVYLYNQEFSRVIGTSKEAEYGPIISMDISNDEHLVCGHEKGNICIWVLETGVILKKIKEFHKTPVLALKFWRNSFNNIISSDSNGVVNLITVTKNFFKHNKEVKTLIDKSAGSICNINLLKKEQMKHHSLSGITLAVLASLEMIIVVSLEPTTKILYKMENNSAERLPAVSWGFGAIPDEDENRDPLLAVVWSKVLYLVKVSSLEEDAKGFKVVAHFISTRDIIFMGWIAKNLIFIVDEDKRCKILYSGLFQPKDGSDIQLSDPDKSALLSQIAQEYTKAIVNTQSVNNELAYQSFLKDQNRKSRPFYSNTIMASDIHRRVFILCQKNLYIGRLSTWDDYIKSLILKGEWLPSLALSLDIYQGKNRMFAGVPHNDNERKKLLKGFCNQIILDYLVDVGKVGIISLKDVWETVILTTIDFLLSCDSTDYLFNEIQKQFEIFGQKENFIKSIETFILQNRIKSMPNEVLKDVINFYKKNDKPVVIQQLIVNLNINEIEKAYLVALCSEIKLHTALMYICIKADPPDFITPLVKLFAEYQYLIGQNNPLAQEMGLKCIWFIDMTLEGKMFFEWNINESTWKNKALDVIVWIFELQILRSLLEIDFYLMFYIFEKIFKPKIAQALINSKSKHRLFKKLEYENIVIEEDHKKQLLYDIITLIYNTCLKTPKWQSLLYYFLASISITGDYKLYDSIKKDILYYLVSNERIVAPWDTSKAKGYRKNDYDIDNYPQEEYDKLRINYIFELFNSCLMDLSHTELNELRQAISKTPYIEIEALVMKYYEDYKGAITFFLNQSSTFQKKKIFLWLKSIIPDLKENNHEAFKAIKDFLLSKLKELVEIDLEKTHKIICYFDKELEDDAIKCLEPFPKLQLKYLREILSKKNDYVKKHGKELNFLKLKLMCSLERKDVLKEFQKSDYEIESAVQLCEQYQILDALAYLYEKNGLVFKALEIHLKRLENTTYKAIDKIQETGIYVKEKKILERVKAVKEVCITHNKYRDIDSESLWFLLLELIINLNNDQIVIRKDMKNFGGLINTFSKLIGDLFDDLLKYVELNSIFDKLDVQSISKSIKVGYLGKSFLCVMKNYKYEANMLANTNYLASQIYKNTLANFFNIIVKGNSYFKSKEVESTNDSVFLLICGHSIKKSEASFNTQNILCAICGESLIASPESEVIANAKKQVVATTTRRQVIHDRTLSFGGPNNERESNLRRNSAKITYVNIQKETKPSPILEGMKSETATRRRGTISRNLKEVKTTNTPVENKKNQLLRHLSKYDSSRENALRDFDNYKMAFDEDWD